jgi:hypothetical protein
MSADGGATTLPDTAVPLEVPPASEQAVAQSQVTRRADAIAVTYRASGEAPAMREMYARTRDLPPAAAAEVIVAARATLESVVASMFTSPNGGGERAARVERVERWERPVVERPATNMLEPTRLDRFAAQGQIATDLARIVEHIGRDIRGEALAGDIAALILDAAARGGGDEYRLSTYALGVAFGTGLTLPLAITDELGRRGHRRHQQHLIVVMHQGLHRLRKRTAATVGALIELTQPLARSAAGSTIHDSKVDAAAGPEVDATAEDGDRTLLRAYVGRHATLLDKFANGLRRVDAIGHDVFFALDTLARRHQLPVELHSVRAEFLAGREIAFAIGQSASAQDAALHRLNVSAQVEDRASVTTMTAERAERVYRGLGFATSRSTLLAQAAVAWRSEALLDARWIISNGVDDEGRQGRIFEALLRFISTAPIPPYIEAVDLAQRDDEPAPQAVWGLPLFRLLAQPA